jgi:hypothetical protein
VRGHKPRDKSEKRKVALIILVVIGAFVYKVFSVAGYV